jgi:type IV pilus assembly protein PilB
VPLLDLDAVDPQQLPQGIVDAKLVSQYRIFPLGKRGGRLFIGCADPTDQEAVERIKFATQLSPEWIVVEYDKLMRLVTDQQTSTTQSMDALKTSRPTSNSRSPTRTTAHGREGRTNSTEVEDAPVVKFLHKMLIDAINLRASDLHFEPYEYNYRVRFRVDGELREITQPPIAIKEKLASRIKVISRLDISEKRVPQDGRMKLKFGSKSDRLPGQHAAHAVRREDRDPDPRPVERAPGHRGPRLRAAGKGSPAGDASCGRTAWFWSPAPRVAARRSRCTPA